jgi:hypothetical protein
LKDGYLFIFVDLEPDVEFAKDVEVLMHRMDSNDPHPETLKIFQTRKLQPIKILTLQYKENACL